MDLTPDLPALDYGTIKDEFETLLQATTNKLDREWPRQWSSEPGAEWVLEEVSRTVANSFAAIRYLCADSPPRAERRVEFALAAGPLVRSLVDACFLVVFLFEDLPRRTGWYMKAGWREWAEEVAKYEAAYGTDPEWAEWLTGFRGGLMNAKTQARVTVQEEANLRLIPYWPTPGQMLRSKELSSTNRPLLEHLDRWYYREFSSHVHLSLRGLAMRSMGLRKVKDEEAERIRVWQLDKRRSDTVGVTILMCLVFMSEVQCACRFGLAIRLRYVWGVLNGYYGLSRELWELRYDSALHE